MASSFETVRFGGRGHLAGALKLVVSLLLLVRARLAGAWRRGAGWGLGG